MIEIRSCDGFDEMQACVQLQIEIWGYDESDVTRRKTFMLAQKIGGQVIGAFDSESGTESSQNLVGFAMSLRESSKPKTALSLTSTRTCWRSGPPIAIAALVNNSNGNNAVRLFLAEFAAWSGPSTRSSFRMLSSISTGWEPHRAPILWISMVYPHLVCRVGCLPTGFWRMGA